MLKIIGGWEQLKAAVNMYRFLDAGPEGDSLGRDDLPAAMNKLRRSSGSAGRMTVSRRR
jgi:hypothetical protein